MMLFSPDVDHCFEFGSNINDQWFEKVTMFLEPSRFRSLLGVHLLVLQFRALKALSSGWPWRRIQFW